MGFFFFFFFNQLFNSIIIPVYFCLTVINYFYIIKCYNFENIFGCSSLIFFYINDIVYIQYKVKISTNTPLKEILFFINILQILYINNFI